MGHLSGKGLILNVTVDGIYLVANGGVLSLLQILTPLNAIFTCNRVDLETILKAKVFVNEGDL